MAEETVRSRPRWSRWLRRLARGLALLVLLLLGFVLWLVGTTSGGRLALSVLPGFLPDNPEYMRYLAEQMAVELQPLVDDIDQKTQARLSQLGEALSRP